MEMTKEGHACSSGANYTIYEVREMAQKFCSFREKERQAERDSVVNSLQNLPLYRDLNLEFKHQYTMSLTS